MPKIVRTKGVLAGEPRLAGHRISVIQVADMILDGDDDPEDVADQLGISLAEVHAALSHYYANPDEMDAIRNRHRKLETEIAERAVTPDQVEQ